MSQNNNLRKHILSEWDLHSFLYDNPRAMPNNTRWFGKQVQVPYGVIDLLGQTKNNELHIVELKKGKITTQALAQVRLYAKSLSDVIEPERNNQNEILSNIKCSVVGDKISMSVDDLASEWDIDLVCFDPTNYRDLWPVRLQSSNDERQHRSIVSQYVPDIYQAMMEMGLKRTEEGNSFDHYHIDKNGIGSG